VNTDAAFHRRRHQGQDSLSHQQPCRSHGVQQHRRQGQHHHPQNGVQGGGHGVALLLRPLRQQHGENAVVRQLVKGSEGRQHQGKGQVAHIGERAPQKIRPQQQIHDAVEHVAAYQEGLAGHPVHPRGNEQGQQKARDQLRRQHQRRGQGAAGLVEHQKRHGKAAGDAAYGAQSAGGDQQGKIPCPESVFHCFSPREYHSTLVRR